MNTQNRKHIFRSKIAFRLWLVMMLLILLVVGAMWIVQIIYLERNYIHNSIDRVQNQINPIMEDLKITDLAENESMIAYLSQATNGKMLLVGPDGNLLAMYTYGYPIDLEADSTEITIWNTFCESEEYANIESGDSFNKVIYKGNRASAYEIGIPIHYYGKDAYLILYHSFGELYTVLEMNQRQLIVITIALTILAGILAILLSKRFTHPIRVITDTVDKMSKGDLTVTTGITLEDELGQLSHSVEKLGVALQRVDVLRKEVIANVSHELRAPLALIGGYAEMVRDIHWSDQETREYDLNLIIKETNRMSEMVSDILDYSQLQSGYMKLTKAPCNLWEVVKSEVEHLELAAKENHIIIEAAGEPKDIEVEIDALKISQVLRNLLYNAMNHTEDGETIRVELSQEQEEVRVSVINPGAPIPEEDRPMIWERYQRSQHQGSRRQGTGIGLSIVSTILRAHNMTYGIDCRDGMTIFWFGCHK